jgi:hypothetical protein
MAVYSNTFGGLVLSGDDAAKFRSQVRYGRPSKAAKEAVARGRAAAEELRKNGYVKFDMNAD